MQEVSSDCGSLACRLRLQQIFILEQGPQVWAMARKGYLTIVILTKAGVPAMPR